MIQEVLFSKNQGEGIISDTKKEVEQLLCIHAEPIVIGDTCFVPGLFSDLENFYRTPIEYLGFLKDKNNDYAQIFLDSNQSGQAMVFHLGSANEKQYFQIIHYISRDRFYIQYHHNSGRDYNRVNGVWCYNKPKKNSKKES